MTGKAIMQCGEARDLADAFIGGELLVETSHEILRHMESCPECRAEVSARRALRLQLNAAFMSAGDLAPRAEWVAALKDQLKTTAVPASRAHRPTGTWFALAATLLIAAGAATFVLLEW